MDGQESGGRGQDTVIIQEVQLVLAEKRTSLAMLRVGIAVALIPISLTTVLVTLSRFYDWTKNLHFLVPLGLAFIGLLVLSAYLVVRSIRRIHHHDDLVKQIRRRNPALRDYLDS